MTRNWLLLAALTLISILIAAEVALRTLGSERLIYRADPEIEYLPLPNQAVFQNAIDMRTNAWGMRSDPVQEMKPAGTLRVLVLGDSIVFGHTNIAHASLATTRLSQMKTGDGRAIEVLNVSATSWGPGNMLAWLDRFGALNADAIVLVLSTHDLSDDRTFKPPSRDAYPQAQPVSLLVDWLWRRLTPDPANSAPDDPRSEGDAQAALPVLMRRVAAAPAGGCLIVHPTKDELKSPTATADEQRLEATALGAGLAVFYGRDFVSAKTYSDGIHLSAAGQQDLVRAFTACPALAGVAAGD